MTDITSQEPYQPLVQHSSVSTHPEMNQAAPIIQYEEEGKEEDSRMRMSISFSILTFYLPLFHPLL